MILPFHYRLVNYIMPLSPGLGAFLNKIEEVTILVVLPLAIIHLLTNRERNISIYLILSIPFIVFTAVGIMSGVIAGNPLIVTLHGTFDYIKYFLMIFIYAAFFREMTEFKKLFRLLVLIAVFMGLVGFVQETWAVVSRYVIGKDIADHSMYILREIPQGGWRLGLYRAPSLLGHYNIFGLYSLLILSMYVTMQQPIKPAVFLSLFTGIFLSVSRMVYCGFLISAGYQLFRKKWFVLIFLVPIVIMLFYLSLLPDVKSSGPGEGYMTEQSAFELGEPRQQDKNLNSYRAFAMKKGLEVWKDHSLWGTGPGMFGSAVAYKYRSHVYEEYNFTTVFRWISSLDQFWPQILAETGVAGTFAFAGLLLIIFMVFIDSAKRAVDDKIKEVFIGLMLSMTAILIFSLGGILNHPPILITFFALAGMALGCDERA